jgi:hypothetical protein
MSQPVECPICFKYIDAKHIQRHVDRCIDETQIEADRHLANSMGIQVIIREINFITTAQLLCVPMPGMINNTSRVFELIFQLLQPKQVSKAVVSKNGPATAPQSMPKSGARTSANTNHVIVNNAPTTNYQVIVTNADQSRAIESRAADPIQEQLSALHEQLVKLQTQQAQINQMKQQQQLSPKGVTLTPPPSPHTPRQLPVTVAPVTEHVTAQQRFAQQLAQFQQKFQNWHVPMMTRVESRPAEDVKVSAPIDFSASEVSQRMTRVIAGD